MLSKDIRDYSDIGLNADWCISAYQMNDNHIIFDTEVESDDYDGFIFELCIIDRDAEECEDEVKNIFSGSFAECVEHFEKMDK